LSHHAEAPVAEPPQGRNRADLILVEIKGAPVDGYRFRKAIHPSADLETAVECIPHPRRCHIQLQNQENCGRFIPGLTRKCQQRALYSHKANIARIAVSKIQRERALQSHLEILVGSPASPNRWKIGGSVGGQPQ
jgi:hypothetical protein